MSLIELLPAVRQLSRTDQVQLAHLLIDGLAEGGQSGDGIPEELRRLLPPPGSVIETRVPGYTDADGARAILAALAESKSAP